jgi:16S rRNA processing protein RimM
MHTEYTAIGTIIGTHALKGEVKVYSTTDFQAERYKIGNLIYIDYQGELLKVKIKDHREHKGNDLLLFEEYPSINDVEKFNKCKIYVHQSQIQALDEDEYYYEELMGCTVLDQAGTVIGNVKDVVNYGASDIIVVEGETKQEWMIPFVNDFIEEVDLDKRTIIISPIEGLLGD